MASERDMERARRLLDDGIHAETFQRVAEALAEERRAVWRRVLKTAELHDLPSETDCPGVFAGREEQFIEFGMDVLTDAQRGARKEPI